ncbi:MAG TPA: ABC transporter ATP-binding protein [Anaerolineales bacterium]|nr:ABC transporter ATP-binding protein [Anaerolineales bacterium]
MARWLPVWVAPLFNVLYSEMVNPFIRVTGLKKYYQMGGTVVRALDGVDLEIPAHTLTVVMGPSGSGKSTLLYLLGGLDRPTAGEIWINGQLLNEMDENSLALFRRKTVGFVFQSFNLISSMTALQNVAFPMQFAGVKPTQREERARTLLTQVGLDNRADHRPTELSGGQQQRVAIARALVNNPSLILADEPTGNLDTASGAAIMQLLSDLHHAGRTVLVVTHDPRMFRFATHKIFLLDGRVVSEAEYQSAALAIAQD